MRKLVMRRKRTWLVASTSFFAGATLFLIVASLDTLIALIAAVEVGRIANVAFDFGSTEQSKQKRWQEQLTKESELDQRLRSLDLAVHFTAGFFACGALGLCLTWVRDRRLAKAVTQGGLVTTGPYR